MNKNSSISPNSTVPINFSWNIEVISIFRYSILISNQLHGTCFICCLLKKKSKVQNMRFSFFVEIFESMNYGKIILEFLLMKKLKRY